ncbi:hypothetical protein DFH06DRAFT_1400375 [Mycena polygramma]|nr:hypothetical protein DFH06DRAFT_1400375 [Mycena polygramma]
MSGYSSFAVVGGGAIGLPIVAALATHNVSVILLSRPGSSPKSVVPPTVEVVRVDCSDVAAAAAALYQHKVDVVISTLNNKALSAQNALADAAKIAGVKLFLPSEFGAASDAQPEGFHNPTAGIGNKHKAAEYLKSINVPSTRIFTGLFIEYIPWLLGYAEHGKVIIVGKGEAPTSFTSVDDVAGFVAYILTALPPSDLENRIFRLEGDRASLNELGARSKAPVEHVEHITGDNVEEAEEKTSVLVLLGSAAGNSGWDAANGVERSGSEAAGSGNAVWPGHHWKTIKEVLHI